jgi:lysophospholipase L1-like esterase
MTPRAGTIILAVFGLLALAACSRPELSTAPIEEPTPSNNASSKQSSNVNQPPPPREADQANLVAPGNGDQLEPQPDQSEAKDDQHGQPLPIPPMTTPDTGKTAIAPHAKDPVPTDEVSDSSVDRKLTAFGKALRDLKLGKRTVVTILHIGDSHVAGDYMTAALRQRFQEAYGNAGRGLISAPGYPYFRAPGLTYAPSGAWTQNNSLKDEGQIYGLTGTNVESRAKDASLRFAWPGSSSVVVQLLKSPDGGEVRLAGAAETKIVDTRGPIGLMTIAVKGDRVMITNMASGDVVLLGVEFLRKSAGIRYLNIGIPGATAELFKKWRADIIRDQIRLIDPQLIIWAYGTNEGFDDDLNSSTYEASVNEIINLISNQAPTASWLIVGPPDAQRRRQPGYACGDDWFVPPKLDSVTSSLKRIARSHKFTFWNWQKAMGGRCGMMNWVQLSLGAKDHVHYTAAGYEKIAGMIYSFISNQAR